MLLTLSAWTDRVPVAVTVVVAKLPSQGLCARPGRQSHTVPAESVWGTVVAAAEASYAESALARSDKSPTMIIDVCQTSRLHLAKDRLSELDVKK